MGLRAFRPGSRPLPEIERIDRMDGEAFTRVVSRLFRQLGFHVERIGGRRGDLGADLIVKRNGVAIAVRSKLSSEGRWIGIDAVQQALGARFFHDCDGAMVVTNRFFGKQAKALAAKADVELWDRDELAAAIGEADMSLAA